LIQYIRGEGIELFEKPKIPEQEENFHTLPNRTSKINEKNENVKNDNHSSKRNYETDKEWLEYCEWLNKHCLNAVDHFLRGIQIGIQLDESWLVCQGAAYLWNYFHHIFEEKKFNKIVKILNEMFDALKKVGHNTEPELLTAVSIALANGLIQPWLPKEHVTILQIPLLPSVNDSNSKYANVAKAGATKVNPTASISKPPNFTIPNEAQADIKKALDVNL
jgi:hypothetical protein